MVAVKSTVELPNKVTLDEWSHTARLMLLTSLPPGGQNLLPEFARATAKGGQTCRFKERRADLRRLHGAVQPENP